MTMTLVSTVTVGSGGAASIEFTSVPQTATDLLVVYSLRSTNTGATLSDGRIKINGLTSGYSDRYVFGNGSSAITNSNGSGGAYWYFDSGIPGGLSTASTFSNGQILLPNYTSAVAKTGSVDNVSENNATSSGQHISAVSHTTTSAITSVDLSALNTNLAQYSTASLYTITKGSGGATVA